MTNKFIESSSRRELLNIFTECLHPYSVSSTSIKVNLDHALHGFQQEMKAPFDTFIKSSPKDMKQIFYQILLKHFLISVNSDSDILAKNNFEKITDEIENLLE